MLDAIDKILADQGLRKKDPLTDLLVNAGVTTSGSNAGFGIPSYGDQESLNKVYENVVWVFACVKFIAKNLASVPWLVMKGKNQEKPIDISDNPLFNLLFDPNNYQTRYQFLNETFSRLETQGEVFWELDRRGINEKNKIIGVYADWRSEEIEIVPDPDLFIKQFIRTRGTKRETFEANQVFYMKYFNPLNNYRGISPLKASQHSITMELNAIAYNKGFFKQGARPSGIFTTEQKLTPAEAGRLEAVLKKKYKGVEQMHEILTLWGGLKYEALGSMSMTDMQFADLRKMNREDIIAAYGLSLEVLGLGQKTYQNVQFYRRMAWTETLMPLNEMIIDVINKDFLPLLTDDTDVYVKPDYSSVEALKENIHAKMITYNIGYRTKSITPNEIRVDVFGKDPLEGEGLDEPYSGEPMVIQREPPKSKGLTFEDRTKLWQNKINKYDVHEKIMIKELQIFFEKQKTIILEQIKPYLEGKTFKDADLPAKKLFDMNYWTQVLKDDMTPLVLSAMSEAAQGIMEGTELTFDPMLPEARRVLGSRVNALSRFVNQTTDVDIKKAILKILQENPEDNIAQLTRKIKFQLSKYFNETAAQMRAARIARTEVYGASNAGTQQGLVQGRFERKMWLTSRDERVRETHQIDGQTVKVDEYFTMADGSQVDYPQDINERCVHIATFEPLTI